MTRNHFATTLGILVVSLAILIVPFCFVAFWAIVLGGAVPWSLVATTPALFLLFVYLECARYTLVVRWYRRLARNAGLEAGTSQTYSP
jgi:membrane protein implicated in regulation of membrane protease activity